MRRRHVPDWPIERSATRVLVEEADLATRVACEAALGNSGYEVLTCGGPSHLPHGGCPLTRGADCSLAAGADVIYSSLNWHDPGNVDVLCALRQRQPDTALVVATSSATVPTIAPLVDRRSITGVARCRDDVIAAVRRAVEPAIS